MKRFRTDAEGTQTQLFPRRRLPVAPAVPEAAVQRDIKYALELYGLQVLTLSRQRRRCHQCHQWPRGGDGVTKGTPDLLVTRLSAWRDCKPWVIASRSVWIGLEIKASSKAFVRPQQKEFAELGAVVIVTSSEQALASMQAMDGYFSDGTR
ncbi:MAG: hypothetical protein LC772_00415 [Chloroflexi bacterium]|nr:hypothetical protein [Chloroflexota bacterium]